MTRNLGYITRRAHPDAPTVTSSPRVTSRGLQLRQREPGTAENTPPSLASVPSASGTVTLTDREPVTRLSALASGIGSLRIGGSAAAWWETANLATGAIGAAAAVAAVPEYGNRALIERAGEHLIVSSRHIRRIRRLIATGTDITITSFGGTTVLSPGSCVVTLGVIDGRVEVRREPPATDITNTYRIGALS